MKLNGIWLRAMVICGVCLVMGDSLWAARYMDNPPFEDFTLPDKVSLCGEPIPLHEPRVREMMDREFTIEVWDRTQVYLWLKRAGRYFPFVEKALKAAGAPEDLKYLPVAESSLLTYIRSSEGAVGPWQFVASTGRRYGLTKNRYLDERLHFERATKAALRYLKDLKEMFGTWTLALAAYNCGEARLRRELEEQGVHDYFRLNLPLETERFIFRIAAIKIIMNHPERFGYNLDPDRIYRPFVCDTEAINVKRLIHIRDVAKRIGTDYKVIKELNPQLINRYLPPGNYAIKVPAGLGELLIPAIRQLAESSPPVSVKADTKYYRVQPGDSLSLISRRTNISMARLKKLNHIKGSKIFVGQRIRLR